MYCYVSGSMLLDNIFLMTIVFHLNVVQFRHICISSNSTISNDSIFNTIILKSLYGNDYLGTFKSLLSITEVFKCHHDVNRRTINMRHQFSSLLFILNFNYIRIVF